MARGHQKIQSQVKAADKQAKIKKQQGHRANEQEKAAQKALIHICAVYKSQMPDPKTYKQHFQNKHPKNDMPEELKDVGEADEAATTKRQSPTSTYQQENYNISKEKCPCNCL